MTDLPVRYCHGCQQYDDHPRVQVWDVQGGVAGDKLYHYDCAPAEHVSDPAQKPIVDAVQGGTRGADLRDLAGKHAASIKEAPADKKGA